MTAHPAPRYRPVTPGLPDPLHEPAFYAGVAVKRAMSWVIDFGLIWLLAALVLPFTLFTALFFFGFLLLITGFVYRWATLAYGSATWGMWFMGIELRQADGGPLSGGTAFLHTLGYSLSIAIVPVQVVSAILMLALGRGQGLTDLALGTAALNRRV